MKVILGRKVPCECLIFWLWVKWQKGDNEMKPNNSEEKHLQGPTHPLCFICGGLSIRTANLIFKSESWLFFGTIIRCNSADLELLEVGYNITCKGQKIKKEHIQVHNTECPRRRSEILPIYFPFQEVMSCPNVPNKPNHFTPTTADGFSIQIRLFIYFLTNPYHHIMSFLLVSLHNELIAQQLPLNWQLKNT